MTTYREIFSIEDVGLILAGAVLGHRGVAQNGERVHVTVQIMAIAEMGRLTQLRIEVTPLEPAPIGD